jgi:hypothetical protein
MGEGKMSKTSEIRIWRQTKSEVSELGAAGGSPGLA